MWLVKERRSIEGTTPAAAAAADVVGVVVGVVGASRPALFARGFQQPHR